MAEKKRKVLLKRSSVPGKMPSQMTGSTAEVGELFLNNASGDADNFLTTLRAEGNSAVTNDYIKWSDDVANEKKFATKEEVMDNELVVSTIITKINESVGLDENSDSVLPNGDSLCDAIIELQSRTSIISATTSVISATTASELKSLIKDIEDNELVTATALSQINASAGFNEDGTSALPNGESLSEAIVTLQNKEPMVSITYSELKTLRDEGKLIPGMKYRITDYVTTTSQESTSSAGHQFDVIVTALDNKTLSEEASACLHDGDTYFSSNNAKLEAWKIWYCLDNDVNRFAWADEANGKGVIYYMKDEWNNECPYDFKNILFLRGLYTNGGGIAPDGEEEYTEYCYTFGWENEDGTMLDTTIFGNNGHLLDYGGQISGVYGNVIKEYFTYTGEIENPTSTQLHLNNIVFLSTYSFDNAIYFGCCTNSFGNDCHSNSFGNWCYKNSFGNYCNRNSFGNNCYSNSFGNECYFNSFGNGCCNNSFGDVCSNNTFGFDCYSNSFGDSCYANSFGEMCNNNTFGIKCYTNSFGDNCYNNNFGNYCDNNSFGVGCSRISFGNWCYKNSFGNSCNINSFGNACSRNSFGNSFESNSFGNDCNRNSFGNNCYNNTFGNNCDGNNIETTYTECCHFDDGCMYIKLTNNETASSSYKVKNYKISRGVAGTYSSPIEIATERNRAYETRVAKNSAGEIKIYCEADLIA